MSSTVSAPGPSFVVTPPSVRALRKDMWMTTERGPGILSRRHRRLTVGIVATIAFIAFEAMAVATAMPKAVPDLGGMRVYALAFSAYFTTSLFGLVLAGEICD